MSESYYYSIDVIGLPFKPSLQQISEKFNLFFQQQGFSVLNTLHSNDALRLFENNSLCFSFSFRNKDVLTKLQDFVAENLEYRNIATECQLGGYQGNVVQFSDQMPMFSSLIKDIKLITREQTPFQELKIYDTPTMGRCLVLDEFINISDKDMEDDYTRQLGRHITKIQGDVAHILIIGGGDCLIANYLLKNYPNIKKITMCELDKRVVDNIMEHFGNFKQWVIKENMQSGRFVLTYNDGSIFVKTEPDLQYDGIIIDSTDTWSEESPSYVLTKPEFYQHLNRILKPGCGFSQMMSMITMKDWFIQRWREGGFTGEVEIFECPTPQYGGYTPFGYVFKDK